MAVLSEQRAGKGMNDSSTDLNQKGRLYVNSVNMSVKRLLLSVHTHHLPL